MVTETIVRCTPFTAPRQYVAIEYSDEFIAELNLDKLFEAIFKDDVGAHSYYETSFKDDYVGLFKALQDLGFDFKPYIDKLIEEHQYSERIPVFVYRSCRKYYTKKASLEDLLAINSVIGIPIGYLISTSGITPESLEQQFADLLKNHGLSKDDLGIPPDDGGIL